MQQCSFDDLRLFVEVAKAGGYAAAARATALPRATLSRRVAKLELDLEQRLIERSSRTFRLTDAGRVLFDGAQVAVARAEEAFASVEGTSREPRGPVRMSAPPSVLQLGLARMIFEYLEAHPAVTIHVDATNRRVDLMREDLDFAVRVSRQPSGLPDQVLVPLASVEHVLVAAPRWETGSGSSLDELLDRVPVVAWAPSGPSHGWDLENRDGALVRVPISPRLTVPDLCMLHDAAIEGLGLALLPRFLVEPALARGLLEAVASDLTPPPGRIHAVHLGHKGMRPAVRHLLDWLKRRYGHPLAVWDHAAGLISRRV